VHIILSVSYVQLLKPMRHNSAYIKLWKEVFNKDPIKAMNEKNKVGMTGIELV